MSAAVQDRPRSEPNWRRPVGLGLRLIVSICLLMAPASAMGQDDSATFDEDVDESLKVELDLLEREPFYELTINAAGGGGTFEIAPVEDVPANPKATDRLRVRLLREPDQAYEVNWSHIERLRTYEQLVLDEARRLMAEKKFDEAFRYLYFLVNKDPDTPELEATVLQYMFESADFQVQQQRYEHALATLEAIVQRDPSYRAEEVSDRIAEVSDTLIAAEVEREDFRKARGIIQRLEKQYGADRIESLGRWRQQLIDQAIALGRQAQQAIRQREYREAERLSRRMIRIWPELPGAAEIRRQIARLYPMVIVGVAEVAGRQDVAAINDWAARRTGRLTQRSLVEFIGAGPAGGQYICPLGSYQQSDDRRTLTMELAEVGERAVQVDGYDVSQRVLAMADPTSPLYEPAWASLAKATRVEDVFRVHIDLRRPHVLPEAMLQIRLDVDAKNPAAMPPSEGPYQLAEGADDDLHFVANPRYPFPGSKHPAEIVERHFGSSDEAIAALRRGDVDVIDYLFPDDAARLGGDESLSVVRYALPTVHVLVPSYTNPFTANQTFRRAVLYGINRQMILDTELLGNRRIRGCQVISGPFPVGTRDNDPLAYAYDARIEARRYYPRLASILKTLAHRSLREMARKRDEELPTDVKLVIGYPGNQVARVSCQAIAQYLQVIGIQCELRELPRGEIDDPTGEVDLLYMQVAMWEPVIDARRLLAPSGVSAVGNEYVGMALRRLDAAMNWRESRDRLHDLHRIVHEQVAIIPLWQTVNYLVYSNRLSGIGPAPLTLYQNVEQWQVAQPDSETPEG